MALSLACRQFSIFLKHCRSYGFMDRSVLDALELAESGEQLDPRIARVQKIDRKKQELQLATILPRLLKEQEQAASRDADAEEGTSTFLIYRWPSLLCAEA
jgi:predicted ATPase